mmetsp:Transcript_21931/g.25170  ORF Transcript_21931/g.25170 Transcript_21931/m.25170 type:complete len:83 (+) Transcript_21931:1020-1268(+)
MIGATHRARTDGFGYIPGGSCHCPAEASSVGQVHHPDITPIDSLRIGLQPFSTGNYFLCLLIFQREEKKRSIDRKEFWEEFM